MSYHKAFEPMAIALNAANLPGIRIERRNDVSINVFDAKSNFKVATIEMRGRSYRPAGYEASGAFFPSRKTGRHTSTNVIWRKDPNALIHEIREYLRPYTKVDVLDREQSLFRMQEYRGPKVEYWKRPGDSVQARFGLAAFRGGYRSGDVEADGEMEKASIMLDEEISDRVWREMCARAFDMERELAQKEAA